MLLEPVEYLICAIVLFIMCQEGEDIVIASLDISMSRIIKMASATYNHSFEEKLEAAAQLLLGIGVGFVFVGGQLFAALVVGAYGGMVLGLAVRVLFLFTLS